MDTNEELKVTNITELEKDNEYYIKYYDLRYSCSGLYKYIGERECDYMMFGYNVFWFDNINTSKKMLLMLTEDSPFEFVNGTFIGCNSDIKTICDIYKLPINEYVLK